MFKRWDYECPACETVEEVILSDGESPPLCSCGRERVKLFTGLGGFSTRNCGGEEVSGMKRGEILLHRRHQKDIEKAAANGTLVSLTGGKRTPPEFRPNIPRTVY